MRTKLIGRAKEIKLLTERYHSSKSELVVLYGRRRVGKSSIIRYFVDLIEGLAGQRTSFVQQRCLTFEALEGQDTVAQIAHFGRKLKEQIPNALPRNARFENWYEAFDFLTAYLDQQKGKVVIALDEFQWMAAGQSKLVALIKYYWDNHWKSRNVMMILCGSIASFMVKKVLRSKALYGRFSAQMHIKKLSAREALEFLKNKCGKIELLKYLLIFGGVPKYLEELNLKKSFEENLENLFFADNALYFDEFSKIFNVHFKEPKTYLKIIKLIGKNSLTLDEVSKKLGVKSSGGVKVYLENLELAEFIRPSHTFLNSQSRYVKYKLSDEFSSFYVHFVLPNLRSLMVGGGGNLFRNKVLKQLSPWFGFAFENYVINNAVYFAERLGFADKVESFGPYYRKGEEGVQVDLIYYRSDNLISVCEMKFHESPVSTEVIPQFEAKLSRLPRLKNVRVQKVLIAPNGVSEALRVAEYFDVIACVDDIF